MSDTSGRFIPMFEAFRAEIDENHATRERTIKSSRDVTALSKKAIFALQRVRIIGEPIPEKIAKEVNERLNAIIELMKTMAPDLQGINAWRYQRQASPGIQEYIEAVSFEHYLRTGKIITHEEAAGGALEGILLTPDDYALGLFDLSGEMMRFAITTGAMTGRLPSYRDTQGHERTVLHDLMELRNAFDALSTAGAGNQGIGRDIEKKREVMAQSVEKVERYAYELVIRGRERPKGWVPEAPELVASH